MSTNSKQSTKNKFLLSLGTVILGSSAVFGFCSQAFAFDVNYPTPI